MGKLTLNQTRMLFTELADTADQIEEILQDTSAIEEAAHFFDGRQSTLYIGRGLGEATCYEGALKLKEISYIHAEAYAAGEMKHGPIALLDEGFPIVAVATQSATYDKTVSNLEESKSRGLRLLLLLPKVMRASRRLPIMSSISQRCVMLSCLLPQVFHCSFLRVRWRLLVVAMLTNLVTWQNR